ncbi:MAG: type II toxin-antitoxin system PemK/MazF family toxin [Myxococcales bacterium]|nr:type II toxin-antitoxin system PemK/MazF family toxin [Myxococcales bacterium]
MKRGEIWWADLGEPRGSSPALRRPVLVVQDDLLNESALQTVMVAPLTSNLKRGQAVGNVTLPASATGLDRASVVLVCQVLALDRCFFDELVCALANSSRRKVEAGLRLALGLD